MASPDNILTLQEIKRQLFIPDAETSQDVLLLGYRDAAIEHVASRSGRHLLDEQVVLEVPVRYVPLSSAPFRVSDLQRVTRIDYHDADTQYWNSAGWDIAPLGYWSFGFDYIYPVGFQYSTYPTAGLRVYRTEAETPPGLNSQAVRFERVSHTGNLWRAWPTAGQTWADIHPYLPVQLTCQVGIPAANLPKVFKVAALIYVRFLWSQMPDFREGPTIDRLLAGQVELNLDREAQRVIEAA